MGSARVFILIFLMALVASVAYSDLGEFEWGTGEGECVWGTASECGASQYNWGIASGGQCYWGTAACPVPAVAPTSSCTFDTGTFGFDCTF